VATVQCRAAVLHSPSSLLAIETIELGPLAENDVLVRIGASSLCHTDLEVIEGQLQFPTPIVLGHEVAGTIVETGSGVDRARVGQRVVLSWNPHCGSCQSCRDDLPILCTTYLREGLRGNQLDGGTRLRLKSEPVATMFFIAGFAEYAIVSSGCAVRIAPEVPFDRACLIGCAVMTGVGAATNIARISPGATVMVIGCGAVGLAAVQGARICGAKMVLAVDPRAEKQALALQLGATRGVGPDMALDEARALTAGLGVDVIIECAGRAEGFRLSAEACRSGGTVVWLGKVGVNDEIRFRWGSLMGEKRFVRSSYGGARPERDFPALANAYLEGKLMLDELITHRFKLDEINSGFDVLRRGTAIRSVLMLE
jgi:S-(hydroxymethyl)glutathione dehydrogenase/alcohol dehydrogenase